MAVLSHFSLLTSHFSPCTIYPDSTPAPIPSQLHSLLQTNTQLHKQIHTHTVMNQQLQQHLLLHQPPLSLSSSMGEQSHRNTTTSPLPPSSSPHLPPQPSTSSKLPFRPRKIRKLSNTNTNTITTTSLIRIPRNLSCEDEIQLAIDYLRSSDPILSPIIDLHSRPIFNPYQPPFIALTKSILYQQLANKAGTLIYTRFMDLCGGESRILPNNVLALTPTQLRHIGISARKSSYLHDLANKYCNDILSDKKILEMDDKSLFTMLTMVKGIGSWSTHMFMIFSLRRPDVLPIGDVAFRKGVQVLYGLEELPRPSQMEHLCEKWRPYRTVGAWYMWRLSEVKAAPGIGSLVNTVESQLPHRQILDSINGVVNFGKWRSEEGLDNDEDHSWGISTSDRHLL